MKPISVFWFRRDLRLDDNTALFNALNDDLPVLLIFIFDKHILNDLPKKDARVEFIHQQLQKINASLKEKRTCIEIVYGTPEKVWPELLEKYPVRKVYVNKDYEPYARERDKKIKDFLNKHNIPFLEYKDHVIFEENEIVKSNGDPYQVYTPYNKAWWQNFSIIELNIHSSALSFQNFYQIEDKKIPSLKEIGFSKTNVPFPGNTVDYNKLYQYQEKRDFPAKEGTSRIGLHLRFGTISIRQVISQALEKSKTFIDELIWREFYQMILWHFPEVVTENFNRKYDKINWRNNDLDFNKWCEGKTGYPLVDAGMRQLNNTGFMHNRVRMITASFLTKHLLIDWRWGEAYFAEKLLDYELASNNGNWQWAAGTGVDAAPYFRIFNPALQEKKFDPDQKYIKKWIPEFETSAYPKPMIDHEDARIRAINTYKKALQQ